MPDSPSLYDDRVNWIRRLCAETLEPLGEEFAGLPSKVRTDIGPPTLVAALLTVRTAEWISRADAEDDVIDKVFATRVLADECSRRSWILGFVRAVEVAVGEGGFGGTDRWDLATQSRTLTEIWCTHRDPEWTDTDLRRLLVRCWDVKADGIRYLLGLGAHPLWGGRTLTEKVSDLPDDLPRAMIAQCFVNDEVHRRREVAMDAQHLGDVEHLRRIAVDLHTAGPVMSILQNTAESDAFPIAGRRAAAEAHRLVAAHRDELVASLQNLTIHECDRLSFDPEVHFRRACLDAYAERERNFSGGARFRGFHGTWGDLPWWQLPADDDLADDLFELLASGSAVFEFSLDEDEFEVTLSVGPQGGEYCYAFDFPLYHVETACELLHLGTVRTLGVDVDVEHDGGATRFGTTTLTVPEDLATQLVDLGTMALRALTGQDAEGYTDYRAVYAAVAAGLHERHDATWARGLGQWATDVPRYAY